MNINNENNELPINIQHHCGDKYQDAWNKLNRYESILFSGPI